LTKGETY